jgi:4a-hydroxytetrahydrobiopterin dehydratase
MRPSKLSEQEISQHMVRLPGWTREGDSLTRQYVFRNFVQSLQFVNQVADAAEAVNHHPDIDIRYNKVKLVLTTHDVGGITGNDIEMAASADGIADNLAS